MSKELPSLEQFEEWVREWQPILSLSDWKFKVSIVTAKKLSCQEHTAECWSNLENKTAEIRINSEHEDDCIIEGLRDWEATIVHELVHCLTDPALPEAQLPHHQDLLYEQGINALAGALVRARRGEV